MGDDGGGFGGAGGGGGGGGGNNNHDTHQEPKHNHRIDLPKINMADIASPVHPETPNFFSRRNTSLDVEDYFTGPRDIQKHSKWPSFLQMHGSIMPKLILPIAFVAGWATLFVTISELVEGVNLGVPSVLLTVLGFVVGLCLSFRSSTAYERYAEGRRYWAQLILASQVLARVFWIHGRDHPDISKKQSTLRRMSCLNLVLAFAVSLKHKLRFEPYTAYDDLQHLVAHLNTMALRATADDPMASRKVKKSFYKEMGEYLGVSFAESNPRKALKKATLPLGNLPLEIVTQLSAVVDAMCIDGQLPVPMQQTLAYNHITILNDIMTGTERVLCTPLPIAYSIAIAQITWVYVLLLPFQLMEAFKGNAWLAIPATCFAAYIILGILFIGREIENPFGNDVNDLPLEAYCEQIAQELDIIASSDIRRENPYAFVESSKNLPLFPISMAPYPVWMSRPEERIEEIIKGKPQALFESMKKTQKEQESSQSGLANGRSPSVEKKQNGNGTLPPRGDEQV